MPLAIPTPQVQLEKLQGILQALDADVYIFSADITPQNVDHFIQKIKSAPNRRPNLSLVLTTYGGTPDAAFRLAKFLQKTYGKITLLIFGYCKSAGTLIAIGAQEIRQFKSEVQPILMYWKRILQMACDSQVIF